jgi:hypothetical protein
VGLKEISHKLQLPLAINLQLHDPHAIGLWTIVEDKL